MCGEQCGCLTSGYSRIRVAISDSMEPLLDSCVHHNLCHVANQLPLFIDMPPLTALGMLVHYCEGGTKNSSTMVIFRSYIVSSRWDSWSWIAFNDSFEVIRIYIHCLCTVLSSWEWNLNNGNVINKLPTVTVPTHHWLLSWAGLG